MSELTPCNYCSLQRTKSHAKEKGLKVTLLPSNFMGGTDVFVHPKSVNVSVLSVVAQKQYFSSWMMEIGDHCEC